MSRPPESAAPEARPAAAAPPPRSIRDHGAATLRLALPVMVARAGVLMMMAVDTAMTGHVSARELAYYGLASAPQVPLVLIGIGLLLGTVVLTAQAAGAGRAVETGAVWRVSTVHAAILGVFLLAVFQAGEPILLALGQDPDLSRGAGRVLAVIGWGVPAVLLHASASMFLEGINRPTPGMVLMVAANVVNVLFNWILIFGNLGAPALGAVGAALATTLVRYLLLFALVAYILWRVDGVRYGLGAAARAPRALAARLRRIGLPIGISHALESSAFSALMLFAGLLGAAEVAGFQIAINLIALPFMCSLGFATAASVRVGNAVGRHVPGDVRRAGWIPVGMIALFQVAVGVGYYFEHDALAGLYSNDPIVVAAAAPAVAAAAFVLWADGMQGVLIGALRGIGDVWPATGLFFVAFWLVMTPLGYVLGVRMEGGAAALVLSIFAGCGLASLFLGLRFRAVSRRTIARL